MQKEKNRDERKTIKIVIKGHKKAKAKICEVTNELEQLKKVHCNKKSNNINKEYWIFRKEKY